MVVNKFFDTRGWRHCNLGGLHAEIGLLSPVDYYNSRRMVSKYRHFDRSGEPEGSAKQNLLNLISINSTKISPLRVAAVEMTTVLLESVNGR